MTVKVDGTLGVDLVQDGSITPAKLTQKMTLGTPQATVSGTFKDFTGIPSWVKRITLSLNGVSLNSTANLLVQVGAGSLVTTGYSSTATGMNNTGTVPITNTTGFITYQAAAAALSYGAITLVTLDGLVWVETASGTNTASGTCFVGGGAVTLTGALDRIRLTTTTGTDTFDAGAVNILYEG